ncbi:MAG: c-type cytochrome [Chromatiaceae bacterium]
MSHHTDTNFGNSISVLIGVALVVAIVYMLAAGRFASEGGQASPEAVAARLAPVGTVNTDAAAVAAAPATAAVSDDPGAATYNRVCQACHATGAAGAPLLGNKEAWQPRIDQGLDVMLQTAINGKGAMPPRGTCTNCSDEDLKAAIEYMVSQVK